MFDLESRLEAGSAEWADEQQEVAAQLAEKEAALAALQAQHGAHTDALVQDCARKVNRPPESIIFSPFLEIKGELQEQEGHHCGPKGAAQGVHRRARARLCLKGEALA